jgi:hypothetical protein
VLEFNHQQHNGENDMNIYTREIAALLKIDLETALRVQNEMSVSGFDFSESSTRQFNAEARAAYKMLPLA